MHAWTIHLPIIQSCSPATLAATVLQRVLGASTSSYTFIDFCAGAGGPTPFIERALNASLKQQSSSSATSASSTDAASDKTPSYATVTAKASQQQQQLQNGVHPAPKTVDFVLTDLHPHPESWSAIAKRSAHITYEPESVDASNAPPSLVGRYKAAGKKVFRLYNLAFHHFDDPLARAILKNTVETSDGFGIFELQDRSLGSVVSCSLFGFFIMLIAPLFYWSSPAILFFIYVCPIIPFVLVFDGLISSLRTRTPEEVEVLLRTCGADTDDWEVKSGREQFMWPTGYLTWVICSKKQ
jgi:hypothetical protein